MAELNDLLDRVITLLQRNYPGLVGMLRAKYNVDAQMSDMDLVASLIAAQLALLIKTNEGRV